MASEEEEMRKRLEFRKMLMKVSDRLSSENLDNLRHLLKDEIPKARLEVAKQGIDMFEALEEKSEFIFLCCLYITFRNHQSGQTWKSDRIFRIYRKKRSL